MAYSSDIYSPNIAYDSGWRFRAWMQYEVQTNNDTTWMVSVKYGVALSSGYSSTTHDYDPHYVAVSSYIGSTKKSDTGWVVDNTDIGGSSYSGVTWHQTGTTSITITKTSSAQTLNLRIWGATSSSGADQAMNSVNLTISAADTTPTMTIRYHANDGQIIDEPHSSDSTHYWSLQSGYVYLATTATGTRSRVTYDITPNTTYPNHWNIATFNLTRPGYHYIATEAWNTEADGTGIKINQDYSSSSTTNPATTKATNGGSEITSDVTVDLFADWKPNTYTITYNGNGNTYGSTADSSHTYDTPKVLTLNGYGKDGYLFKGWATSEARANAGIVDFKDNQSVCSLTTTNGGTVTLYAVWSSAPPFLARIEDDWYGSNKMWVNINGAWKPVISVFAREGSVWKEV